MSVALSIASYSMDWRSLPREILDTVISRKGLGPFGGLALSEEEMKFSKERATAVAKEMEEWECIDTVDFHFFNMCSGMRY